MSSASVAAATRPSAATWATAAVTTTVWAAIWAAVTTTLWAAIWAAVISALGVAVEVGFRLVGKVSAAFDGHGRRGCRSGFARTFASDCRHFGALFFEDGFA